jgi:perosamine synthetase
MYISAWPGLTPNHLLGNGPRTQFPYPLSASTQNSFCVARSGIYHLFRTLRMQPGETVLMPDYYSGNEDAAARAAGASVMYYPIRRNLEPDLDALSKLIKASPRIVYVIHYLGWPQPIEEISQLCRRHGSILVEDCALSMLSESGGRTLGTFGDYSVFCLYKTLPVPNGGLLVQNNSAMPRLQNLDMKPCPAFSELSRSAELVLEGLRARSHWAGELLLRLKRIFGKMFRALGVPRVPVGDIGWNLSNVNVAMSAISTRVMGTLDYAQIRRQRRENFLLMQQKVKGRVTMLREDLPEGVCPLFFPILVKDKHKMAAALHERGISAVEFWNDPQSNPEIGSDARYLRAHVLELPIHQDVTPSQVAYMAEQIIRLNPEPAVC